MDTSRSRNWKEQGMNIISGFQRNHRVPSWS